MSDSFRKYVVQNTNSADMTHGAYLAKSRVQKIEETLKHDPYPRNLNNSSRAVFASFLHVDVRFLGSTKREIYQASKQDNKCAPLLHFQSMYL